MLTLFMTIVFGFLALQIVIGTLAGGVKLVCAVNDIKNDVLQVGQARIDAQNKVPHSDLRLS